ncbi:flavin reductase family protein [Pararobbsia silviterrae]|uniref:Flavin reductase n=1 Tax=Pararobbsia silviterrae TaxID=1792498 RepID=A0A494Y4J7_9BURK|nr:flavin reductase family protein [Pararobbsia silviterrae]RKP57649.1 flavin reductase [Pararobbsia silviterrae]
MHSIDTQLFRKTFGALSTGVTVITTLDAQAERFGVTANSFTSVSLDPPLVLWSQSSTSRSHAAFRDSDRFVIHILADDQSPISDRFARSGGDKFVGLDIEDGIEGLPIIRGCAAYLECRKIAAYPGGDHVIFLGHVEHLVRHDREPLVYKNGQYLPTAGAPALSQAAA